MTRLRAAGCGGSYRGSTMGKNFTYACIALLALTGLAVAVIPNGMRFTGWLLLAAAAVWAVGNLI